MTSALFVELLFRWGHIISGVTWIGLLYYLNLIGGAFTAEASPAGKVDAATKLQPRVMWWFRWAAMSTFIFGLLLIGSRTGWGATTGSYFATAGGKSIAFGGILGTIMWFNVWFIIWPNQKVMIATAQEAAQSGKPAANLGKRPRVALLTSRTNVMLSIPMLFFMAASHYQTGGVFLKF
jgi:uncharacterized membrane protein